jgi:hypothetical protein
MAETKTADESEGRAAPPLWRNPLTVASLGVLALHLGLRYAPTLAGGEWPRDGGFDTVALALLVLATLPAIAPHLSLAKLPGGFEFAFREVQRRQRMAETELAELRFIVEGFVTEEELRHLRNIQNNVGYCPAQEHLPTLQNELRRLLALRLIDRREGHLGGRNFAIADGHERKIGEWFRLTPRGVEYLAMRARNAAEGTAHAGQN